jgi:hypothetical protein
LVHADILTQPFDEQLVVVFPELALFVRAFCGLCGPVRFSNTRPIQDWKIFVDELDLAGRDVLFIDSTLRVDCKIFAVRSLEIAELHKRYFGVGIAARSPRYSDASRR